MELNNLTSFLGLMQRSGNISFGETLIEEIRKNKVFVTLIAGDIGEASKKKIIDKCTFYHIPYFIVLDKDSLSKSIGKGHISAIGVKSIGGANKIINMLKGVLNDE